MAYMEGGGREEWPIWRKEEGREEWPILVPQ